MPMIASLCTLSALLTALICRYSRLLGAATGLIDRPDGVRKLHANDTPAIGGIAVMLPILVISLVYFSYFKFEPLILASIMASGIMLVMGALDDLWNLPAYSRLATLALVVLAAFYFEPMFLLHALRLNVLGLEFVFGPFTVPITLLMVVGFVNATNMADGLNGQLLGSIVIWCLFIMRYTDAETSYPFIALIGSSAIALLFNLRGQLFSGSAGAYSASLFIALGTIAAYRRADGTMNAEIPVYWFWLPVLDCLRLIAWRVKEKRSPFSPDRNHIHHVLLKSLKPHYALLVYLSLLAAPGVGAMVSDDLGALIFLICLTGYLALLVWDAQRTKRSSPVQP